MRLIDADALNYVRVRIYHEDGTIGGYNAVIPSSEITNAPTIDAVPVSHGRWKFIRDEGGGNSFYSCSECGYGDIQSPEVIVPYCWHCGAKLDAERREE